jgi:predicted dehydrogenase
MSRKTCVGFVGTGGIARRHFEALEKRDDVELVGFCDVNEELAKKAADKYGGNHFTSSIVMHESVQLDCVFICIPPFAHGEAEKSAIERGVPFLIEKPINMHLSQAEEIAAAVSEANLLTSVGYMNRYRPGVQRMKQLVAGDPPILVLGGWIGGVPGGDAAIWKWWVQKEKSGGQFVEQVTHTVDLVRYLCGDAAEVSAHAVTGRVQDVPDYDIEDAVVASIKFEGGSVANIHSCCSSNARGGVTLNVYCHNVAAEFSGWGHDAAIYRKGEDPEQIPGGENVFDLEDDAFIDAVRTGDCTGVLSSYADGLETLRTTLAVNESFETGRPVSL